MSSTQLAIHRQEFIPTYFMGMYKYKSYSNMFQLSHSHQQDIHTKVVLFPDDGYIYQP